MDRTESGAFNVDSSGNPALSCLLFVSLSSVSANPKKGGARREERSPQTTDIFPSSHSLAFWLHSVSLNKSIILLAISSLRLSKICVKTGEGGGEGPERRIPFLPSFLPFLWPGAADKRLVLFSASDLTFQGVKKESGKVKPASTSPFQVEAGNGKRLQSLGIWDVNRLPYVTQDLIIMSTNDIKIYIYNLFRPSNPEPAFALLHVLPAS